MKSVIKVMKCFKDSKEKFIFRDKNSKVFFISKEYKNSELLDSLVDDKFYIVLITYSAKNHGFVKPFINGKLICEIIKEAKTGDRKTLRDLFNTDYDNEVIEMINRIYNYDENYQKDLEEGWVIMDDNLKQIEPITFSTEVSEWLYEALLTMSWLIRRFDKKCK